MISQPLTIIRANKMGKPYIQNTDPSLTNNMVQNDLWLNVSEGTMKAWDGTQWVEMQFGESAIMDDCITNRMLANDISASKITAGILQSADGSFYLNLDTGEAELLNLVMGGQVEGNIIATSSNGLTRVRLRGKEGTKDITAGIVFEERENTDEETAWDNAGQIYFGYSNRQTFCTVNAYMIGKYMGGTKPTMGFYSGTDDGYVWRSVSSDYLRASYQTFHGLRLASRDSTSDSFSNVTPVLTSVGAIMGGTAVVGTGTATCTYKFNEVMQIDFRLKITTAGSGSSAYGISTSLLRTLNTEIPALTPLDGGVLQIFNSSGTLLSTYTGASFLANGVYWQPSYVSSGALTAINESVMTSGITLVGTAYGTYTFED